ncbi:MAG: flippase-like domain-containing protein [Deltaproteobacteria bacterium]|nr:flippase-like domain-containing protein [Deltaproteobacteria bacterium]
MKDPKVLIGMAISAVCVGTVVHGIEWSAVGDALRRTNLMLLLPALGFLALVFLLRALRWQRLVTPIAVLPLRPFWSASLIGFMANDILPLRMGEVVRGYALAHLTAVPVSAALATSVLERVWDTVTVGILALFTASQFPLPPWVARTNWTVLLVSLAVLLAGAWLARQEQRQLPWLPARFAVVAERFLSGFRSLQSLSALVWVIGLSFAVWFALVGYYWILLRACGFALPFSAALLVMVFTVIAAAVPAAPGFVGTFQYAVVLALSFFSVTKAEALGFSIVAHLAQLIPVIIAGLIALVRARLPLWPSRLVSDRGAAAPLPTERRVEVEGASPGGPS